MAPTILSKNPISRTKFDAITFNFQRIDNITVDAHNVFTFQNRSVNSSTNNNLLYEQLATSNSSLDFGITPFAAYSTHLYFIQNIDSQPSPTILFQQSDVGNAGHFMVVKCTSFQDNTQTRSSTDHTAKNVYILFPILCAASSSTTEIDALVTLPTNEKTPLNLNRLLQQSSNHQKSSCYFYRHHSDTADSLFFVYNQPIKIQSSQNQLNAKKCTDRSITWYNDIAKVIPSGYVCVCAYQPEFSMQTTGLKIAPPIKIHVQPDEDPTKSDGSTSRSYYEWFVYAVNGVLLFFACVFVVTLLGMLVRSRSKDGAIEYTNDFTVNETIWVLGAFFLLTVSLIVFLVGNNFAHNAAAQTNLNYAAGFVLVFSLVMLLDFPLSGSSILQWIRSRTT